jgi:ABC-2 type transport system ATP-binding protein
MQSALAVKGLSKKFPKGGFALNNVTFEVPAGSIVGFIGANGAGKSTTIGLILHTLTRDDGEVELFGKSVTADDAAIRDGIGVVYDSNPFPENLNPKQISKAMRHIYSNWDDAVFREYLTRFKLPGKQKVGEYSRGMSMKLAIAVALAHHPKLLILDEATSGLDPIVRDEILDVFLEFVQDEQHSILLSSHITSDLEKVSDYITFIHDGEIVISENKDKLTDDYGIMRCTKAQFNNLNPGEMLAYRKHEHQVDVLVTDRREMANKYGDIPIDRPSIEDVMLTLVRGEKPND